MSKNNQINPCVFLVAVLVGALMGHCNEPAPEPVVVAPPAPPAPAPQPQIAPPPVAPPATPIVPIAEEAAAPSGGLVKKAAGVDAPLPGAKTEGDELMGNYGCRVESEKLQIGPIKAPPFGCRIFKGEDGTLRISSTAEAAGSLTGVVKDSTVAGFFIVASYEIAGNKLEVKTRMKLKGEGTYAGAGRGRFNDEKEGQFSYKFTMTKK